MFIRRKPNKSGTFSVQVLDKRDGRNVLLRSFGSSRDESELIYMEREASDFISRFGGQGVLDFDEDGVNGFVATIGDDVTRTAPFARSLAEKIGEALDCPTDRRRMIVAESRRRIRRLYSAGRMAASYLSMFRKLVM